MYGTERKLDSILEEERLEKIILALPTEVYWKWVKFRDVNRRRIPLYPGSKIRKAVNELMWEFIQQLGDYDEADD